MRARHGCTGDSESAAERSSLVACCCGDDRAIERHSTVSSRPEFIPLTPSVVSGDVDARLREIRVKPLSLGLACGTAAVTVRGTTTVKTARQAAIAST
jgi:hypothetical protein